MKFVKCVGALHLDEVKAIFAFHRTREGVRCLVMPNGFQREFPEKFPFGADSDAMEKIQDEADAGPFVFLVIFYEEA